MPCGTDSLIPLAASTPSPSSATSSDSEVTNVTAKGNKSRGKSADWTEKETFDLLQAWGPKYEKLRSASQREKIALWNEIYSTYKECYPGSTRTLAQVKKRQKNLEYEFKQLKQRTRSTGEAGIKSIKDGFPYFDLFDEVMGHRDSVDPSKMAIEGSATFANGESGASNAAADVTEISMNSSMEETPSTATDIGEKRKTDEKSRSKVKRKRRDVKDGGIAPEWQSKFFEMWERSMEEDNARYERSAEMFREAQNKQMEQTNAILAGFKDIFVLVENVFFFRDNLIGECRG